MVVVGHYFSFHLRFITEYVGIKELGVLPPRQLLLDSQIQINSWLVGCQLLLPQTPTMQEGTLSDDLKFLSAWTLFKSCIDLLHPVQTWLNFLAFFSQNETLIKHIERFMFSYHTPVGSNSNICTWLCKLFIVIGKMKDKICLREKGEKRKLRRH